MSAGITIVEVNLSVLCGFIALAFFAGIGGTI
jgi:hypothetical protein